MKYLSRAVSRAQDFLFFLSYFSDAATLEESNDSVNRENITEVSNSDLQELTEAKSLPSCSPPRAEAVRVSDHHSHGGQGSGRRPSEHHWRIVVLELGGGFDVELQLSHFLPAMWPRFFLAFLLYENKVPSHNKC